MNISKSKEILEAQNKLIDEVFQTDDTPLEEVIQETKQNGNIEGNGLSQIQWDGKVPAMATDEDINIIKDMQTFIQMVFDTYQLKTMQIYSDVKVEDVQSPQHMSEIQQNIYNLIVDCFLRCTKFGKDLGTVIAETKYRTDLNDIETLYTQIREENMKLHNEVTDLKDEISKMKKKRFLGIFKVFR